MDKTKKTSQKIIYLLLAIIILAGILRYSYAFFVEKQGTHSDEEWSFGLANSYYEPYIYSSDNDYYYKNMNEWLLGEVANDYLTVQEDERFSFGSVYYNMECDTHPPLYFFILHFLSSFFVDEYVEALGLIINLIAYIMMSIFLYKLITLITKSHFAGVAGVLFNTFTVGLLSMTVFIRMYMLLATFAVIFTYLNAKIYYDETSGSKWAAYIELSIVTCLGSLTQHLFLPFAYIITAIMCLVYLGKRDWKRLAKYAGFTVLGVAASIIFFPAILEHMFGISTVEFLDLANYEGVEKPINTFDVLFKLRPDKSDTLSTSGFLAVKYCLTYCFELLFTDLIGVSPVSPFSKGYLLYAPVILLILIILTAAACFLFRNETWFIKRMSMVKPAIKRFPKNVTGKINWFIFSVVMAIIFIVVLVSAQVDVISMQEYSSRYLFIVYPLFNVLYVSFVFYICKKIFKKKNAPLRCLLSAVLILTLVYSNCTNESPYLWKTDYPASLLEEVCDGSDVIIVSRENWLLTIYTPFLRNCNEFYYTSYYDILYNTEDIEAYSSDNEMYLILETNALIDDTDEDYDAESSGYDSDVYGITNLKSEYLEAVEVLSNTTMCEYVGTVTDFKRTMEVYRIR